MKTFLIENAINNNNMPLIIIKLIVSFILEPINCNINDSIINAFTCYNCSLNYNNYFNYNLCCSERCLLQIQGIYSDDEYDPDDTREQYIENCKQDAFDDYYSD